ncbi:MAG TPA: nucleoside triphosphate pyrophosphohydrolase [Gemmatimonadaceae bacterium]|nr:nucleoside triphosphate pyrophosphohydrolase [Gemmatimonadaceae bacterium]
MTDKATLEDALALMRDLRARCDWDRAQTHESLRPYLIEEAHELDDALRRGDRSDMREELGDVLLQVLFHSVIAEEQGAFDINGVAGSLIAKMRERHPHLYGGGERRDWEEMKASKRESIADGLPAALPTLHRAYRLQERAAGVGFDWDDTEGPARKVEEELAEVRSELAQGHVAPAGAARAQAHLEDELGDLLFAVINLCRRAGVHPALALDRATDKFARRFEAVEALARERGIVVGDAGIAALDALWNEVKLAE